MKIFTAAQIRACDAYTIKAGALQPAELMERAATKCVAWIKDNFPKDSLFVVLCGTGNNGGDGMAITRLLHQRGFGVKAFLLKLGSELSADCNENLQRLLSIDKDLVGIVEPDTFITDIPRHIVIVDAILGTGLNRQVEGWLANFIRQINLLPNPKIAIDIPSGLSADTLPDKDFAIFKAIHTLSFQFYKRSFLHSESGMFTGSIQVLDIGLDKTFINYTNTHYKTIDQDDIRAIYKPRNPYAHKGVYGSVLMVAGSYGKIGAAVLSSKSALRAGAGLVTALTPECGYEILQSSVPEVMCTTAGTKFIDDILGWESYSAIGLGPGMGTDPQSGAALEKFIDACKMPIVLDADALNLISLQPDLLSRLPKGSVITPHPKEFVRLFGDNTNSMIQLDHARIQAMKYNINIVLKGHHTAIVTSEGECWYNLTGNAGMATAGSGDVLTGIITGLMAQGYQPHESAIMGVFIHGLAGDIAAGTRSQESLIASDITENLGRAFLSLV